MLKKDVTYIDYNGNEQTDTLYFNLNETELLRLEVSFDGGLEQYVSNLDAQERPEDILNLFEKVLAGAYGEKSEDAKHFIKNEEMRDRFLQSAAYNTLLLEFLQDPDKVVDFFNEVIQGGLIQQENPN